MQIKQVLFSALALAAFATAHAQSPAAPYPAMAPLAQYLMPADAEIALARSAAPKSISDSAEIMVLKPEGYATAVKGTNDFVCLVERSWGNDTPNPQFWNPKMRAPHCFNTAAFTTFAQIYLMKTKWVLHGKSRAEILQSINSALDKKQIPPLAPGAMVYMMSRQQYLNDHDKAWHPHTLFIVSGDSAKTWGADLPGSPIIAANDPEERVTIFMIVAEHWSDGSPAPSMAH
jgi:hypothetical protein